MTNPNIPHIPSLPDSTLILVGQQVDVGIHETRPDMGNLSISSHELVRNVVKDVFTSEGVVATPELEILCTLVGRVVVGRIATSKGFTIKFGDYFDYTEAIRVELKPSEPVIRDAPVDHYTKAE